MLVLFELQAVQTLCLFVVNLKIKYNQHSGCNNTNQDVQQIPNYFAQRFGCIIGAMRNFSDYWHDGNLLVSVSVYGLMNRCLTVEEDNRASKVNMFAAPALFSSLCPDSRVYFCMIYIIFAFLCLYLKHPFIRVLFNHILHMCS